MGKRQKEQKRRIDNDNGALMNSDNASENGKKCCFDLEGRCSIQLSYGRTVIHYAVFFGGRKSAVSDRFFSSTALRGVAIP